MGKITRYEDLKVYQLSYETAMEIFNFTKNFPQEERYSLTDQIRRSSRSVCANIVEAFYRRKYKKSFILRLVDAEAESAETKVWLNISRDCGYIDARSAEILVNKYNNIIAGIIVMINQANKWTFE